MLKREPLMLTLWRLLAASVAIILANTSGASAQLSMNAREAGGVGIGLLGAAFVPQSVSFRGAGNVMSLSLNSAGRVKLDPGPVVGGIIEYQFDPRLTIQGAFGYATSNLSKF